MTTVDRLWYRASEARQQAEQLRHRLADRHTEYLEYTTSRRVSRARFRTITGRIVDQGLPYGAHTLTYSSDGRLLLVRHAAVDQWVLPGGEIDADEHIREGARRELAEEAGIDASYEGLGILGRVEFYCDGHQTWGVLPIFEATPAQFELTVADPDGEITDADWFDTLPEDTRDREILQRWRDSRLG